MLFYGISNVRTVVIPLKKSYSSQKVIPLLIFTEAVKIKKINYGGINKVLLICILAYLLQLVKL